MAMTGTRGEQCEEEVQATSADGSWYEHAACQGMDTALFFPAKGHVVPPEVKEVCARCPVRAECLAYAIETHQAFGVWGGLTVQARARHLRQLRAARSRH